MLLGSYRQGQADDPEVYIAAVVRILTGYPIDVAMQIADPLSGLPSRLKWRPQANEIVEACEAIMGPRRRDEERAARIKAQLAARDTDDQGRAHRPSYEDLKAKHGENWGIGPDPMAPPKADPVRDAKRQARRDAAIVREYAAAGVEPVMAGDMIVSPSLLRSIGRWPAQGG